MQGVGCESLLTQRRVTSSLMTYRITADMLHRIQVSRQESLIENEAGRILWAVRPTLYHIMQSATTIYSTEEGGLGTELSRLINL